MANPVFTSLILLVITLFSISAAASIEDKIIFIVPNEQNATLMTDISKYETSPNAFRYFSYEMKTISQFTMADLDNQLTVFFSGKKIKSVVEDNASADAVMITANLFNFFNPLNYTFLTAELSSAASEANLRSLFPAGGAVELKDNKTIIDERFIFITDDKSPATDVVLLTDVLLKVEWTLEGDYYAGLLSEISQTSLDKSITFFIYKSKVLIILGGASSASDREVADEVTTYLISTKGIKPITMSSSDLWDMDLKIYLEGAQQPEQDESINETTQQSCYDTDETDYFIKGKINYTIYPSGSAQSFAYEDLCLNEKTVKEYFCSNEHSLDAAEVQCNNGCLDGACLADDSDESGGTEELEANQPSQIEAEEPASTLAVEESLEADVAEKTTWWHRIVAWFAGMFS